MAAGKGRNPRYPAYALLAACALVVGLVLAALTLYGLVRESGLWRGGLPATARILDHVHDPDAGRRGEGYVFDRTVPLLAFADASGRSRRAHLTRVHVARLPVGSEVEIIYDPEDPTRVRVRDEPMELSFYLALGGLGLAMSLVSAFVLIRWRRPRKAAPPVTNAPDTSARAPLPDPDADFAGPFPRGTPKRLYSLAGWPVMRLEPSQGGLAVMAMDRESGAFVLRTDLNERFYWGSIDLDELDMTAFRALSRERRAAIMARQEAAPLVWTPTDDAEFPFRGRWADKDALIRLNDFPAEPVYSVLVDGQNVGNLEGWPANWTKIRR